MRRTAFAFAALALVAPALPARADATLCNGLQTVALWLMPQLDVPPAEVLDDGCRWGPAQTAPTGTRLPGFGFDSLELQGEGLEALLMGRVPPRLELTVIGARPVISTGDPAMDWLLAAQQRRNRARLHLDVAHDVATGRMIVSDASVTFTEDNAVRFSGEITSVPADPMAADEAQLMAMGLSGLRAEIRTKGLFEGYILMALGGVLLSGGDPEARVAALKEQVAGMIALAPGSFLSDASKAALNAILADLPNPNGTIRASLTAEPPLGPQRFGPALVTGQDPGIVEIYRLLSGVTVEVQYDAVPLP